MSNGPLTGLRVLEFVGIGPGPHCAMLLADLGAEVLRIQRKGGNGWPNPVADRNRSTIEVDIRSEAGRNLCTNAAATADVLIEGFRPGVMERAGLGPEVLCANNPRLVYARMTGWGQDGPLAKAAGHDINYIAITGVLAAMGRPGEPAAVPLNLVGDFGGGSMFLALGILAALWERDRSGTGQVIDAAIVDGTASLMGFFTGLDAGGYISLDRSRNILAGAAPWYRCYLCKDGKEISVGAIEPHFFAEFLGKLGLSDLVPIQLDEARWPELAGAFARAFAAEDRDHWAALFDGSDACVAPVLTAAEAPAHPHHVARQTWVEHEGLVQPAPTPRFSRTPGTLRQTGEGEALLAQWGVVV